MSNKAKYQQLDEPDEIKLKKGTMKHPLRRSRRAIIAISLEDMRAAEQEDRELAEATVARLIGG